MNEMKENHLIKARKFCDIFRFIINLNSLNGGKEIEVNYCYIYPKDLVLGRDNNEKHEAIFFSI